MIAEFAQIRSPRALAVLRIVTAFLFMQQGTAKLLGVPFVEMFVGLKVLSLPGVADSRSRVTS